VKWDSTANFDGGPNKVDAKPSRRNGIARQLDQADAVERNPQAPRGHLAVGRARQTPQNTAFGENGLVHGMPPRSAKTAERVWHASIPHATWPRPRLFGNARESLRRSGQNAIREGHRGRTCVHRGKLCVARPLTGTRSIVKRWISSSYCRAIRFTAGE
jgi:hypothetical protein